MAVNTSSNNLLYLTYKNSGPTFALIGPALLIWLIAICGVTMNSFVIFTTYRTNSLRGTANYLMALICLAEAVHQMGHSIFLGVVVTGVNFVDLQLASWLTLPQHFFMGVNLMGILLASADRLLAVATGTFHSNICLQHKRVYLSLLTIIMALWGATCSYFVITNAIKYSGTPTTACLTEVLPVSGDIQMLWFLLLIIPLVLSGLCYVIIGAIIRCNKSVSIKTNTRLLRSLFIILCVTIGGYVVNLSIYEILLTIDFGLSFVTIWELSFIAGALLNICAAANASILYINSTEYRKAFKQQWAAITNGNQGMFSTVRPINTTPQSNNHSTSQQQQNPARISILESSNQIYTNQRRISEIPTIQ